MFVSFAELGAAFGRGRTVGEAARLIGNCRGRPLSNAELYRLARRMVVMARRKERDDEDECDEDDEECDDYEENQDEGSYEPQSLRTTAKDPSLSMRPKRECIGKLDGKCMGYSVSGNTRGHLPTPTINWTYERRLQRLVDSGMGLRDAALVAAASPPPSYSGHAFDAGPGRGSSGAYSMDAHYVDMPPPASFPRDSQYGKDGRGVAKLERVKDSLEQEEDAHDVASLMRFADHTEDLPLPNTVARLVKEAGNRRAEEEKRTQERHTT
jgi:hypothetical protein